MSHDAISTVKKFLDHLSSRNLSAAAEYLSDGALMIFPGGRTFTELPEFVKWAQTRYQDIAKDIQGYDQIKQSDSDSIVYCYGTLHGHWTNREVFQGVRFIDRFRVVDGKIVRQDVWNDLAEHSLTLES